MSELRLKGQEISVRAVADGVVVDSIDSVSNFNENVDLEQKQEGFLGETANRFDQQFNGFGGDFEFQVHNSRWVAFQELIIAKAKRENPGVIFNVVVTEFYPNGDTVVSTYVDVSWGAMPKSVPSKNDYVKIKGQFACASRPTQVNSLA